VTIEELDFWADGITNTEVAEILASAVLRHASAEVLRAILPAWVRVDNPLRAYAALLTAAFTTNGGAPMWNREEVLTAIDSVLQSDYAYLWRGAAAVLLRFAAPSADMTARIHHIVTLATERNYPSAEYLRAEIGIGIE
jgi:hypothetical protein